MSTAQRMGGIGMALLALGLVGLTTGLPCLGSVPCVMRLFLVGLSAMFSRED